MRRGPICILALALCIGGVSACSGDDGDSDATATTTTSAPASSESTTTALEDPSAAVDEFCATTEEIKTLVREQEATAPTTPQQGEEVQALVMEAAQMMFALRGQTAQMVPGDVTRFQECSALFGNGEESVPEPPA
jgi:hypothetical protein